MPFFYPNSPTGLTDIDSVEPSPKGPKRMLLPWFSVDFCVKFPLKTDLEPWPLANTCIFLFRPHQAISGTGSQCRRSRFAAGAGGSLLVCASSEPVPASPRACGALHHHQASSCPSSAQPCLTTGREAGKPFMELEKVYHLFSEGGFGFQASFLL